MFVYDGQVTGHNSAGTALDEAEHLFLVRGVQVVEEDPSYTPSLSSVPDVEVSVTPGHQEKKNLQQISLRRQRRRQRAQMNQDISTDGCQPVLVFYS